ncbi:hypothetical protein NQ314_017909, partial [Rhamnusium bicolor]
MQQIQNYQNIKEYEIVACRFFLPGGLPRAWSTPCLGPCVRSNLKPPLLQQAAFDDLIFKVDVMRNVASKHVQSEEAEEVKVIESNKWGSLPALNLLDKEELRSNEDADQNGEEGLQEVAGKLEIRVVPTEQVNKEIVPRPQTLSPLKQTPQNGLPDNAEANQEQRDNEAQIKEPPPRPKIERTKSILKQSSKERNEMGELASPKREQITFAPEPIEQSDREIDKKIVDILGVNEKTHETDRETQCDIIQVIDSQDTADVKIGETDSVQTSDKLI